MCAKEICWCLTSSSYIMIPRSGSLQKGSYLRGLIALASTSSSQMERNVIHFHSNPSWVGDVSASEKLLLKLSPNSSSQRSFARWTLKWQTLTSRLATSRSPELTSCKQRTPVS